MNIVLTKSWKDVKEDIENKLRNIIETKTYVDKKIGDEYGYEVYIDKRYEVFGDNTLKEISKNGTDVGTNQYDYLNEIYTHEWEIQEKDEREDEIIKYFKEEYPQEYEDYEDEIVEWIREYIYAYVNPDDINQDVDVAITLDVGDRNYDFDKNNVFNTWNCEEEIDPLSPVVWIARKQGKLTDLKKAIKEYWNGTYEEKNHGQFVNSCMSELENQFHCMSTMTFLVRMGLHDYIKLQGMIRRQKELNDTIESADYYYNVRPDSGEYITLGKNVECGLFNPWLGGGSTLEIALEKDIKIPMKAIWSAWIEVYGGCPYGYSVDEVYGLDRRVFREIITLQGKETWE